MIKIIKEGTRKIAKCSVCGCEFSYEEEDIEKYEKFLMNRVRKYYFKG